MEILHFLSPKPQNPKTPKPHVAIQMEFISREEFIGLK